MPLHLLLEDSEISHVEILERTLSIHFSAANVEQSSAHAPITTVSGYATGVLMQLKHCAVQEIKKPLIGRIHGGTLWIDGVARRSCALPFACFKPIKLELEMANRALLVASATELNVIFAGEANFYESLFC